MRRRRQRLEVSTFPFLAVLLCTMGSLILVLLVIDRKGKAGARAKAVQMARLAAEQRKSESAEAIAARQAEWERRRQALRAALEDEVSQVRGKAGTIQKKIGDAQSSLQDTERRFHELSQRVATERATLTKAEQDLAMRKGATAAADKQSEAAQAQLRRMAADLDSLERTLQDLKTARQRQQNTWSLVPYRGKHGDSRRPVYVECSDRGLIFHPDQQMLEGYDLSPMDIRQIVERRFARQKAMLAKSGVKDQQPYLLMLLRPSGIANYYRTVGALVGLDVEFGYELVDEDWVLDFPDNDDDARPQPWMTTKIPLTTSSPGGQGRGVPGPGPGGVASPGGTGPGTGPNGVRGSAAGDGPGGVRAGTPGGAGVGGVGIARDHRGIGGVAGGSGLPGEGSPGSGYGLPGGMGTGRGGVGLGSPVGGVDAGSPGVPGGTGPGGLPGGIDGGRGPARGTGPGGSETGGLYGGTAGGSGRPGDPSPGMNGSGQSPTGTSPRGSGRPGDPSTGMNGSGQDLNGTTSGGTGAPGAQNTPGGRGTGTDAGPETTGLGGLTPRGTGSAGPSGAPGGTPGTAGSGSEGSAAGTSGDGSPGTPQGSPGSATPGGPGQPPQGAPGAAGSTTPAAGQPGPGIPSVTIGTPPSGPKQPGAPPPDRELPPQPGGPTPPPEFTPSSPGSGSAGGDGDSPDPAGRLRSPTGLDGPPRPSSQPTRPPRLNGGRDWIIPIECTGEGVVVPAGSSQKISAAVLQRPEGAAALRSAVQIMIDRRQATVRRGEAPYRPQLRFLVHRDGLRSYFFAFPALEPLQVPMTRANVGVDDDKP